VEKMIEEFLLINKFKREIKLIEVVFHMILILIEEVMLISMKMNLKEIMG
jgi:hypothetical protein